MEEKKTMRWTHYYLRALMEPEGGTPATTTIDHIGEVKLFVHRDKNAPNRWAKMRKPRILVEDGGNNALSGYAAVFICETDEGNEFLSSMEDPAHQRWHQDEAEGWTREQRVQGQLVLKRIRAWVNETLQEMASQGQTTEQDIIGLADFLPADAEEESDLETSGGGTPTGEGQPDPETGLEVPAPVEEEIIPPKKASTASPSTLGNLDEEETAPEEEGRGTEDDGDGSGAGGDSEGGGDGTGAGDSPGDGPGPNPDGTGAGDVEAESDEDHQIGQSDVSFRSFAKSASEYRVVLRAKRDCSGSMHLRVVGEEGRWDAKLVSATANGTTFSVDGATVSGIELKEGQAITIDLHLDSDVKLCLGMGK